jgi:hypothetical protein
MPNGVPRTRTTVRARGKPPGRGHSVREPRARRRPAPPGACGGPRSPRRSHRAQAGRAPAAAAAPTAAAGRRGRPPSRPCQAAGPWAVVGAGLLPRECSRPHRAARLRWVVRDEGADARRGPGAQSERSAGVSAAGGRRACGGHGAPRPGCCGAARGALPAARHGHGPQSCAHAALRPGRQGGGSGPAGAAGGPYVVALPLLGGFDLRHPRKTRSQSDLARISSSPRNAAVPSHQAMRCRV